MKRFWIRKVAGFICLAVVGVMVFSGIVMLLWNALLPELFHFPVISFWQALGLLILTKLLFGGFRGGGPRGGRWKDKMKQRWMNMSPEEKEKFKQDWGRRCRPPFKPDMSFKPGAPFSNEKAPSSENPI
ncbi:MAG TPA: hypothetical protein VNS58_17785 [Puia sp.]|nr:hypothetical protein [Puia sp.]